ncbi:hypothetical protein [Kribbella endophytica]
MSLDRMDLLAQRLLPAEAGNGSPHEHSPITWSVRPDARAGER